MTIDRIQTFLRRTFRGVWRTPELSKLWDSRRITAEGAQKTKRGRRRRAERRSKGRQRQRGIRGARETRRRAGGRRKGGGGGEGRRKRTGSTGGGLRGVAGAEAGADFFRFIVFERTGMALLLGDSNFRKHIENRFTFNFQLPCQIVDSNLAHPPFRPPDCSAKSSYQPHGFSFQARATTCVSARESHLLLLFGRSRLLRGFSSYFLPTIFFNGVGG